MYCKIDFIFNNLEFEIKKKGSFIPYNIFLYNMVQKVSGPTCLDGLVYRIACRVYSVYAKKTFQRE